MRGTPVQRHELAGRVVLVKREDLSSPFPGPRFAKIRGVLPHIAGRPERSIGVLDTFHSKAGWAVAACCRALGRRCTAFYPVYRADGSGLRAPQVMAAWWGAGLAPLAAGRSAILYHRARAALPAGGYMMPNALKLPETVAGVAEEVARTGADAPNWVVPASSATIAAGVLRGLAARGGAGRTLHVHLGYSRPEAAVRRYLDAMAGEAPGVRVEVVDEGYAYRDAVPIGGVPFPTSPYYDGKAWAWLARGPALPPGDVLFWNIGQ